MPTESQLRDPALRAFIARSIDEGRLPLIVTKTIGVGFGSGAECVACGQMITREQIEYHAFGPNYRAALRLHWGCHVLWQLECVERMRRQQGRDQKDPQGQPKDELEGEGPFGNLKRCFVGT
jgi:hypothetical protein